MEERPTYYAIIPADVRYDEKLRDKAKLLYGEITSLSDKNGYCFATNKYFADLYGVSSTTISLLIKELIDNNYIESEIIYKEGTKEILNRYLKIVKYPYLRKLKYPIKENLKDNNTSINNTSINNKINKKELENEFEQLWSIYPRKEGKKKSLDYYIKARQKGVTYDIVKQGIEKYVSYVKNERKDKKYILQGKTYFCNECWNDEYDTNESYLKVIERECMEEENE